MAWRGAAAGVSYVPQMCLISASLLHFMVKSAICPSAIKKNTTVKLNRAGFMGVGEERSVCYCMPTP